MKFNLNLVAAIAVSVLGVLIGTTSSAADDVVDLRDAVKRVREGLASAMSDLPANATTASQTEARHKAAEKVRTEANTWRIRAEFTVTDIEFVRPDLTAINVKASDVGANAATGCQVLAKIPVELGQSIRKGDRIRLTGPAVLSISPLDNIHPNAASSEWSKKRTEVAFSADPRPGGGHNDQPADAWPRWVLSLSNPTAEDLGAESAAKQTGTTQAAGAAPAPERPRDALDVAREISETLDGAWKDAGTTVAKKAALENAQQQLAAKIAGLKSAAITLRVSDVGSTKPEGDKTRVNFTIDRKQELPSGVGFALRYSAALSAADAAIATAGPCDITLAGKPEIHFSDHTGKKLAKADRPLSTVLLRSNSNSHVRWELLITNETDSAHVQAK